MNEPSGKSISKEKALELAERLWEVYREHQYIFAREIAEELAAGLPYCNHKDTIGDEPFTCIRAAKHDDEHWMRADCMR